MIRNKLKGTFESNSASLLAHTLVTVLYRDFTTNIYSDGSQDFHNEIVIGSVSRYISLLKITPVNTSLDPRMKGISMFMNDDDMYSSFAYLLSLIDEHVVQNLYNDSTNNELHGTCLIFSME